MSASNESMMTPRIEDLLERAGSKFTLVALGSKRARQINSYYNQVEGGLGTMIPPQVTTVSRKPLSIAFEEISTDMIVPVEPAEVRAREEAEAQAKADAAAAAAADSDDES